LDSFIEKGCNYTKEVKNTSIYVNYFAHMSFANIVGLISHFQDATPSRQTVYNELRKCYGKLKLSNSRIRNYSGNYDYDEQYIKFNGVKYYILVIFDIELNVLLAYDIVDNLEKETIQSFIDNSTKNIKRISLTTDARPMYKNIAKNLGFIHNLCIFHIIKELEEIVGKKMKNKKLYDNQKACYYDSKEIILKILRSKKLKNAKKLFNDLMNHLNKIPKDLADFVKNKIKPNFDSYMRHLEFYFLPTTNNKMENYFGVTLPRHLKKIFKTIEGITI
jgi:hypothetical protein